MHYQVLRPLDGAVVDGPCGDLVEGYDGDAVLKLPVLQQRLAGHLCVHHHIVQSEGAKEGGR